MKTLNVSISEREYNKFGLKGDKMTFNNVVKLVSKELARQHLERGLKLSEKYGISKMSMDEITEEVRAVRKNAKSRN